VAAILRPEQAEKWKELIGAAFRTEAVLHAEAAQPQFISME
jgi:hypothetical protein